jgi:hypothetical protein
MGWAGPANGARLSHRRGQVDFDPKWLGRCQPEVVGPISARSGWADLPPKLFIYFFRTRPDLAQNFGLGQPRPVPTPLHE